MESKQVKFKFGGTNESKKYILFISLTYIYKKQLSHELGLSPVPKKKYRNYTE